MDRIGDVYSGLNQCQNRMKWIEFVLFIELEQEANQRFETTGSLRSRSVIESPPPAPDKTRLAGFHGRASQLPQTNRLGYGRRCGGATA